MTDITFSHTENENYSQMKNNIINQSSRIAEILSHGGKFKTFYNELTNNIVDSMNKMIKDYVKSGKKAIVYDIYDGVIESINFENLKSRFNTDVKSKVPLNVPQYSEFEDSLENYTIDKYDSDILANMYSNIDESTVKKFAKLQEEAINNLSDVIDSVTAFENELCNYRVNAVECFKKNVEGLYAMHVNYARMIIRKDKDVPNTMKYGGKSIKMYKGQKEFIMNGLKTLLDIK